MRNKEITPEIESGRLMEQCRRFDRCSVPICPLDIYQDYRTYIKGEPKCTLPKADRIKIGKGTALPMQGMTKKEWGGRKSWDSLNSDHRKLRKSNLTQD